MTFWGHSKSGKAILEMEQRDGFLWCRDEDGWQPAVQVLSDVVLDEHGKFPPDDAVLA